jgi:hypothetical protein
MEILLALAAAVSYGVSDLRRRRPHPAGARLRGLPAVPARQLRPAAGGRGVVGGRRLVAGVGWGAAAGLAGVVGTSLLYQGLAIGRMSVVAEPEGGLEESEDSCNEP